MTDEYNYGFTVDGPVSSKRSICLAKPTFATSFIRESDEAYLSLFTFGQDFHDYFVKHGSERGYQGPCSADWVFFDIDNEVDLERARDDALKLVNSIRDRYGDIQILRFFSRSKGFHVGFSTTLFDPKPSIDFPVIMRRFCLAHATRAGIKIDTAVYSRNRIFRLPNSLNPKSHLLKVEIDLQSGISNIINRASEFKPSNIAFQNQINQSAVDDWDDAVRFQQEPITTHHKITAMTIDFIKNGATSGERAICLFKASANLAECGVPLGAIQNLLYNAARNSGLTDSETQRQIACGYHHGVKHA